MQGCNGNAMKILILYSFFFFQKSNNGFKIRMYVNIFSKMKKLFSISISVGIVGVGFFIWYRYQKKFFSAKKMRKVKIQIPSNVVGYVIGKCESTVKAVELKLATKIKFDPSEISDFVVCIVKGDEVSVEQTVALLNSIVKHCNSEQDENCIQFRNEVDNSEDEFFADQILFKISDFTNQILHSSSSLGLDSKNFNNTVEEAKIIPDFVTQHTQKLCSPGGDGFIPIYVSAVATPEQFWVQVIKTKEHIQLDRLTEELSEYFQSHSQFNTPPPIEDIKPGYLCVALLSEDERWYRAEVCDVTSYIDNIYDSVVDLYLLDYGESVYQKISSIRAAPSQFLNLKFQAVECGLMHVKPTNDGWSDESITFFEKLTHATQWYALMARVDSYEDNRPRLTLVDSNSYVKVLGSLHRKH